jgi:dihydrofolate synthase/folylpolyglutamate synthase
LLASVGDPHHSFRTVHIGGTNGKGSVAVTLAALLAGTQRGIGLYSSPHLCSLRERMQVDQQALSEAAIVAAARRLWPAVRKLEPSFFEATTAIGMLAFAEAAVQLAVVEVGLGGRLDSTNVIEPELSIITNIAFDHADYLGNTIAAIAREKAGIIKPETPLLTAERDAQVLALFAQRAAEQQATMHVLREDELDDVAFDLRGTSFTMRWRGRPASFHTPLIGRHQAINAALALRALGLVADELETAAVQTSLSGIRWPGRLQLESVHDQTWIFDVAHNVAGVQAMVETVAALPVRRPLVLVLGILGDKDWRAMLPPLFALADQTILTIPPTAPPNRTWDPQHALRYAGEAAASVVVDFRAALEKAHVVGARGTVLVTGSFHTVGDALISLNRTPFGSDVTLPQVSFAG